MSVSDKATRRGSTTGIKRALSFRSSSGSISRRDSKSDLASSTGSIEPDHAPVISLADSEDVSNKQSQASVEPSYYSLSPSQRLDKFLKDFLDSELKYVTELESLVSVCISRRPYTTFVDCGTSCPFTNSSNFG